MRAAKKKTPAPERERALAPPDDGAETPTEQRRAARMMSVAGSFDDPAVEVGTRGYGPLLGAGAPSLEEAVQRFMRAAHPEAAGEGAVFRGLLGEGPPIAGKGPAAGEVSDDATVDETAPASSSELIESEESEELVTERHDPAWDALLQISFEAARERELSDALDISTVDDPAEEPPAMESPIFGPHMARARVDEPTAAATPAAMAGERSARPLLRDVDDSDIDVEDKEEESFRRDEGDDDAADEDSEEILDDRGRLLADEPSDDSLAAPTPPQGEAYPPAPLRRRATRDQTPPMRGWSHTPSHLALPRIDAELLAERRGLDPANTAEPITVDPGMAALAGVEESVTGDTAERLTDSDILTNELDVIEVRESLEADLRATRPYEPLTSRPPGSPVDGKASSPQPNGAGAKHAAPVNAPPPAPTAQKLPIWEAPDDLVPIAPVQVKRLDQPTARGFRLSLEDVPALGREYPVREVERAPARPSSWAPAPAAPEPAVWAPAAGRKPASARRHWPIFAFLAAIFVLLAALGGLWIHRQQRAARHMEQARQLTAGATHLQLQAALEQLRMAATQGGRNAEVVALAAAAHARLAYEFGESHLGGVASLAEEAKRLGAVYEDRAADDLRVADAYLRLATSSLPAAISRLRAVAAARPQDQRLRALFGRLLMRAGRLQDAEAVLEALPGEGRWLRLRAGLAMARGQKEAAAKLWARARAEGGATQAQVDFDKLRFGAKVEGDAAVARRLGAEASFSKRERAWAELLAAAALAKKARWKDARAYLAQAVAVEPLADPEFHVLATRVALRAGEHKQAYEQAERALQLMPESPAMLGLRATVALALDDEPHARALLARCGKSCAARKRLLEAEAALLRRAYARAEALLEGAGNKGSLRYRLLRARLLLARGQHALARRELSALHAPNDERVLSLHGISLLQGGELVAARRMLERAVGLHPYYAEAHWALGSVHTRRGNGVEARQSFERAVAANPYALRIQLDLGRLLLRLGRFAAALEHFEAVLRRDAQDTAALAGRARCRVELSEAAAERDIQQLAARGHRDTALLLRARLEMRRGRHAHAARLFARVDEKWLKLRGRALVWQAICLAKSSKRREALRQLQALAERGDVAGAPISERLVRSAALLALGELAYEQKSRKDALHYGTEALRSLPPRFRPFDLVQRVRLLKARCHRRLGAVRSAIDELKEITVVDAKHPSANQQLGEIFLSMGKTKRAVEHLALAKKGRPRDRRLNRLFRRACSAVSESSSACE